MRGRKEGVMRERIDDRKSVGNMVSVPFQSVSSQKRTPGRNGQLFAISASGKGRAVPETDRSADE
jgi:hypothetical protein